MTKPLKTCNTCGREYNTPDEFLRSTSRWRICDRGNLWFNCGCHSTNMIVKGKFDWYSPDQALSEDGKTVFNQLPSIKELPHIPHYVMQLQELIQKENTTSKQLADVAKKAPLLASNILRIANNQTGSISSSIESLEHAITYLGLNALKDMVLVAALNTFKFECQHFKADDFWEMSFLCGRISEFLAKRFAKDVLPDEAYIAGTLANVGKVVQAIVSPDVADTMAMEINDVKILGSWIQAEERNSAFDHCILGEIGAMFWGLPSFVVDPVANHHRIPKKVGGNHFTLTDIITLANQLTHWVMLEPTQMDEEILIASYKNFGITPAQAEDLVNELLPLKSAA